MAKVAKKSKKKTVKKTKRRRGLPFFVLIIFTMIGVVSPPTLALALVGLAPSLAVLLSDRSPQRTLLWAVAPINLVGVAPQVYLLHRWGATMTHATELMFSPIGMFATLGSAAIGWGIWMGMPALASLHIGREEARRLRVLRRYRKRLVREWGEDALNDATHLVLSRGKITQKQLAEAASDTLSSQERMSGLPPDPDDEDAPDNQARALPA